MIGYTDLRYCISFCLTEFAIFLTCRICFINIVLNILQENLIREIRIIDFNKLGTHRIRLRTRAIFLFFRPRLRRKCAHRQNRQHHAHRKRCTEKSRTLFSHALFLFSFVILQAPTPKRHRLLFKFTPPYNISRGILLENRFEFFSGIVEMFTAWPDIPGNIQKQ